VNDLPKFIKKEIEKMQEPLMPLFRKASKYGFWSLPFILFSFLNLISLLFFTSERNLWEIIFFAAAGAFGMALLRESKLQKKQIQVVIYHYILQRIAQSQLASEALKKKYMTRIKRQPAMTIRFFIGFLEEEHRGQGS
jgi:hypothetical protein